VLLPVGRDVGERVLDVIRSDGNIPAVRLAYEVPDFHCLERHNLFMPGLCPGDIAVIRWVVAQTLGQAGIAAMYRQGVLHVFLEHLVLLLFLDRFVVLATGRDAVEGSF